MEEEKTQTTGPKRALPKSLLISLLIVLAGLLIVLFLGGYLFGWSWTGFGAANSLPAKTLWDWLQLLIIPAALAGVALWFNAQQTRVERQLSIKQSEIERETTQDQQRENALQTYLDRMAELLLQGKLRESEEGAEIRQVARARTLTVLRRLDTERKTALIRFLSEASLVGQGHNIISLSGADLSGADLSYASLREADLRGADLSKAKLFDAKLQGADLIDAKLQGANLYLTDLSEAKLYRADLSGAGLKGAKLKGADLHEADLREADLSSAQLGGANLSYASLREANLSSADLRGADLIGAQLSSAKLSRVDLRGVDLIEADLSRADLRGANLSRANLFGANLMDADLSSADLSGARIAPAQWEKADSLENATLPDGAKYSKPA